MFPKLPRGSGPSGGAYTPRAPNAPKQTVLSQRPMTRSEVLTGDRFGLTTGNPVAESAQRKLQLRAPMLVPSQLDVEADSSHRSPSLEASRVGQPSPGESPTSRSQMKATANRWRNAKTEMAKSKAMVAQEIETQIATTCASRTIPIDKRAAAFGAVMDEMTIVLPAFRNVFDQVAHFVNDIVDSVYEEKRALQKNGEAFRQTVAEERDELYRDKFTELTLEKKRLQRHVEDLQAELKEMRRAREAELATTKEKVWGAVKKIHTDESEHQAMRELITAVFRTNEEMRVRIQELEGGYAMGAEPSFQGDVTPSNTSLAGDYRTPQARTPGSMTPALDLHPPVNLPKRKLQHQVTSHFMEASRAEMERARLSTQRILVQCASESQSTFKYMFERKEQELNQLRLDKERLDDELKDFEQAIHARRFRDMSDDDLEEDIPPNETPQQRAQRWLERGRLTPRPALPFEIQSELGVKLRGSTKQIARELATLALEMRRELHDSHIRIRRLSLLSTWMDESIVSQVAAEGDIPYLKPTPTYEWSLIPHFLRTRIEVELPNERWTALQTGRIVKRFFEGFDGFVQEARSLKDDKVCSAPTVHQWERFKNSGLPRNDASVVDMQASAANTPIGYVVSVFIQHEVARESGHVGRKSKGKRRRKSSANRQQKQLGEALKRTPTPTPLSANVSPQTDSLATTPKTVDIAVPEQHDEPHATPQVLELRFSTFAYNLWHSVQRYRKQDPLMELFISVLEGYLPYVVFNSMSNALDVTRRLLADEDTLKSNMVGMKQMTTSVVQALMDKPSSVWREGIYACSETMRLASVPLQGKLKLNDLMATENHSRGPSPLTRFIRHHCMRLHRSAYDLMEKAMRPLVIESKVKPGMMLIRVHDAERALRAMQGEVAPAYLPKLTVVTPTENGDARTTRDEPTPVAISLHTTPQNERLPVNGIRSPTEVIPPAGAFAASSDQPEVVIVSPTEKDPTSVETSDPTTPITATAPTKKSGGGDKSSSNEQGEEKNAIKVREAAPQMDFVSFFKSVVANLPRLNASVHCRAPQDDQDDANGTPIAGGALKKRKGKRRPNQANQKAAAAMAIVEAVNDQELTEWYALEQAIRLTPLPLKDRLHKPPSQVVSLRQLPEAQKASRPAAQ